MNIPKPSHLTVISDGLAVLRPVVVKAVATWNTEYLNKVNI